MKRKLVRIGNSYGVRIPRETLAQAGLSTERPVRLQVGRGRIVILADAGELAVEARRQSALVSEKPAREAGFWESLADDAGWK